MPSYTIPTFNLLINIWRGTTPITNPPDVTTMGNLAWGNRINNMTSRTYTGGTPTVTHNSAAMTLLLPKLTDIRGLIPAFGQGDTVEAPAGSGRYYTTLYVDDIGKGFANEHRAAIISMTTPVTYPLS